MVASLIPPLKIHVIALTTEELLTLGVLLDTLPEQPEQVEDTLEGIYDKIDPILTAELGEYWDEQ